MKTPTNDGWYQRDRTGMYHRFVDGEWTGEQLPASAWANHYGAAAKPVTAWTIARGVALGLLLVIFVLAVLPQIL